MYYKKRTYPKKKIDLTRPTLSRPDYTAYTDGACWQEKYDTSIGRGGYGAIVIENDGEKFERSEYSEGYVLTTNNRMELMAVITALRNTPEGATVRVYSDSQYVINIMRGINKDHANFDLWHEYWELALTRQVDPVWVRGHDGNINNEKCDRLAKRACRKETLLHDEGYEDMNKSYALEETLDIPERFKQRNVKKSTRDSLITDNHVNPQCADAILDFWACDSPQEDEYGSLKTFGMDYWSGYLYDWFVENCEKDVIDIVDAEFDDFKPKVNCLRWYMRGLSLYDAIRKAQYDLEIFMNK